MKFRVSTKKPPPPDGSGILGVWTAPHSRLDYLGPRNYSVVHYLDGEWRNPDNKDIVYRMPDLWTPLPKPSEAQIKMFGEK